MSSFVDKIVKILKEKNYNIAAKDLKMLEGLDKFGTENFLNILVREYRCSGGTDTANPAAGNRCSGTGIPHLLNCLLPASLLA